MILNTFPINEALRIIIIPVKSKNLNSNLRSYLSIPKEAYHGIQTAPRYTAHLVALGRAARSARGLGACDRFARDVTALAFASDPPAVSGNPRNRPYLNDKNSPF